LRTGTLVICAVLLTGSAALAGVRLAGLDDGTVLAMPITGLPYVAVGTVAVAFSLLGLRSRRLVWVAAVLAVVQLCWLVPRFVPHEQTVPAGALRLRVATANTHRGRADPRALVDLVRGQRVDVLVVQELPAAGVRALDDAGLRDLMPYREPHPEVDSSIFSRLPLTGGRLLPAPTAWPQVAADVSVGGRTVHLIAVHTEYPLGDPGRWAADLHALAAVGTRSGPDTVMLGDFNATVDHAPLRALLTTGLADSDAELGRAWARTWPVAPSMIPLVQLDHVLHGRGLAATAVGEPPVAGTDHRAVVADLALLGPAR
jgi:endonuclease/exonuclease/phosphatase (EEP) superfamily protein YafD